MATADTSVQIKPTVINRQQVDAIEARAQVLADKLATNSDLTAEIELAVKINDDNKKSTFGLHLTLTDMFTAEELAALPEVGSMAGQTDNFDQYRYTDTNGAKRNGSFWRKMAQDHPVGAAYMRQIEAIVDASKVNNAFTGMNDGQRKREKKELEGKFNTFLTKMKDAFSLFSAIKVANELPGVVVDYAMEPELDDKGHIVFTDEKKTDPSMIYSNTTQPIRVGHKFKPDVCKYYTVPNFLRLNVEKCSLNGGTYEAFITSNARDVEPPTGDGIEVKTFIQFESAMAGMVNWIDQVKADTKMVKYLIAQFKGANSDARILTMFDLIEGLSVVSELPEIKTRYEQLVVDGADRKSAAAIKLAA